MYGYNANVYVIAFTPENLVFTCGFTSEKGNALLLSSVLLLETHIGKYGRLKVWMAENKSLNFLFIS